MPLRPAPRVLVVPAVLVTALAGCLGVVTDDEASPAPGAPVPASGAGGLGPSARVPAPPPGAPTAPASEAPAPPGTPAPLPPPDLSPPPPVVAPATCEAGGVGPSPLFLLSRTEYDNTIGDLLGDQSRLGRASFVREDDIAGFASTAEASATPAVFDQYLQAAEKLADNALKRLPMVLGCDRKKEGDARCAAAFVDGFGARAFRRPLLAEERSRLLALFGKEPVFEEGIRLVLMAVLQSPHFLYRVELGKPGGGPGRPAPLTGYELASRLSYFLWDTMPDAELLRAAGAGELEDSGKLRAQAERLLAHRRAAGVLQDFHLQWLLLSDVGVPERDAKLFPGYGTATFQSLQKATAAFLDYTVRFGDGTIEALLTSTLGFADARLLAFFGNPGSAAVDAKYTPPTGFMPVAMDPATRAGLLTQHSLLTVLSYPKTPNPIRRGAFVREHLLCDPLPPPPPDVDTSLKENKMARTFREVVKAHSADPRCRACHELVDPLGFPFDRYDSIGQYRDRDEAGQLIDVVGHLDGERFDGVKELAQRLVATDRVGTCLVKHWFRYAFGRGETEADRCVLTDLEERLRRSRGNVRELLLDIVTSVPFRHTGATP